ncbi:hypothetical protein ACRRTK_015435 [Alexandromys fortis]
MWCSPLAITHMCFLSLCSKLCETHFSCSRGPKQLHPVFQNQARRYDVFPPSLHSSKCTASGKERLQGFRVKCVCCEGRVGNRSQGSGPKPSGPWVVPMGPPKTLT